MNPIQNLLKSRKFITLCYDMVISLVLYFGAKYLAPEIADDMKFVIAAIQPVFIALIAGIAAEDAAAKRNGTFRVDVLEQ